jgi:hypothetical protein
MTHPAQQSRPSRRRRIAIGAVALAVSVVGGASALASGGGSFPERKPFTKRCGMEIRAYDDGSASLYCDGRRKPFAAIDAESGRVRFFASR